VKKKIFFVAAALVVILCACNRVKFVNKLEGTWKLNKYLYAGQVMTSGFDTTNAKYTLIISGNYQYTESWTSYSFRADSTIIADTLGYDTPTMTYHITHDTLRFVDTTITPFTYGGRWTLLNSEEDLQLVATGASDSSARIFNILTLTKSNLNLLNGNKEYDLTK
jgi:hypothetical protein